MKKLIFLLFIALFVYSNTILSQPEIFSRVLFSPTIGVHVVDLTHSFDDGYMLAVNKDYQNGMIIKVDSECNEIWAKEIVNTNVTLTPNIELNSIIKTYDSCFVISGNALNPVTNKRDALCMKIDQEGDTIWTTTLGDDDEYKNILSSCITSNSGFLLTGSTSDVGGTMRTYITMLDSIGHVQWVRKIEIGDHYCSGNSIKRFNDSTYLLTGHFSNYPPYEGYPFLISISETGQINWAKKYITNELRGRGNDIVITETGLILYIAMNTGSSFLHTDFQGNVLWNGSYNIYTENNIGIVTPKLYRTSDNYLLGVIGNEWDFGKMFKLDMETNTIWSSELFLNPVNVTETVSGEYFVYGNGPLLGVKNSNSVNPQVGFIQVDTMGNGTECVDNSSITFIADTILSDPVSYTLTSDYTITNIPIEIVDHSLSLRDGCVDFIGSVDDNTTNKLMIYPNPAAGIFNISLQNQETGIINIFNSFGQLIYQNNIVNKLKIDLNAQPGGVYYYLFEASDAKQFSGKLVIAY